MYAFILNSFNYALVLCVLLFARTLHLMLYPAPHNEYMSTTTVSANCRFYLSFVIVMSRGTYDMRVVLVGHTIVSNESYLILPSFARLNAM